MIRQVKLPSIRRPALQHAFAVAPVYAIGSVAAFWTIDRVVCFLPMFV
jgi:hypothetical protein